MPREIDNRLKVLFICTHNRCRSILSEAITNHYANRVINAKSAGSSPVSEVHPLSIKYLQEAGINTNGLYSQSWDEHEAWQPDVVITVCDSAAGEPCPAWFGDAVQIHWGLVDPSSLDGSEEEIAAAFRHTISIVKTRIEHLLAIDLLNLSTDEVKTVFNQVVDA